MRILYAASEAAPFAKSGGLADVAGALPKALVKDGIDARVVMPLYGDLKFKDSLTYITKLCDQNNIPFATNLATAEMLIMGLARGDLDWRDIVNPKTKPFTT